MATIADLVDTLSEALDVDRDPFGKPGGLAMTGRARNWAPSG